MASTCGAPLNRPRINWGRHRIRLVFCPASANPFQKGGKKPHRYARFPPRNAGFLRSPAKKARRAFFPWLPLRRIVGAPPRASRARSRGGLAFPPLSPVARVCFVPSSSRKGFASAYRPLALRSLSLPLRFLRLRSLGVAFGLPLGSKRRRGSLGSVPLVSSPQAVPPCARLVPATAPRGGLSLVRRVAPRRSAWAFPAPRGFWVAHCGAPWRLSLATCKVSRRHETSVYFRF
jgi:hypothetical protein